MSELRIGVVGGGIVGLAVARALQARPGVQVVVLEKEDAVGRHQTGHSSGVVHAGLYYRPGSLKARLCADGRSRMREYCRQRGLPYDERGKLVVAVGPDELGRLDALERTARANEVPELRRVSHEELRRLEPHVTGIAALHSPRTAVTDFVAIARSFADDVTSSGGQVVLSCAVTGVAREGGGWRVTHTSGVRDFDHLVLCGGLQSDRLARLAGDRGGPRIVPFRGEFLDVVPGRRELVRGLVYPVPDPSLPFLGVHFTRGVDGRLEVGPNAVLAGGREAYRRRDLDVRDLGSTLAWPGAWRMARRHWRAGMTELRGSLHLPSLLELAQRYVPELRPEDVRRGRAGIRAQSVDRDGALVDDFRIRTTQGLTSVRNAPSPAATASLGIADLVASHVLGEPSRGPVEIAAAPARPGAPCRRCSPPWWEAYCCWPAAVSTPAPRVPRRLSATGPCRTPRSRRR